jgi:hypothetical protein
MKIFERDEAGFERVVFAEVLIPETLNVYGDYHTKESVKVFAYEFMINGFGHNVEHDNPDLGQFRVVESFIARDDDTVFVPGSWVIGVHIMDDEVWENVLSGKLNGFSYEALASFLPIEVLGEFSDTYYGVTEEDPYDNHTHNFVVIVDEEGRPVSGGTTVSNGHRHDISHHSTTDVSFEHSHRFNYTGK